MFYRIIVDEDGYYRIATQQETAPYAIIEVLPDRFDSLDAALDAFEEVE